MVLRMGRRMMTGYKTALKMALVWMFCGVTLASQTAATPAIFDIYPFITANPQNTHLAMLYPDAVVIVELETGQEVNRLTGFEGELFVPLAWSQSGLDIAFNHAKQSDGGDLFSVLEVWKNVANPAQSLHFDTIDLSSVFQVESESIYRVVYELHWFADDERLFVMLGSTWFIWDLQARESVSRYSTSEWGLTLNSPAIKWLSGDLFLIGDNRGGVILFDVSSKQELQIAEVPLQPGINTIYTIDLSNDKTRVVATESESPSRVYLWDLNASQEAFVKLREPIHPGHGEDYTIALSWSPDDRLIASFGGDYRLNIWDSVTGEIYTNIAVPQDTGLYSIVWSADGSEVIYARSTGELVRVPAPQLPDPTPAPATVTP